MIAVRVVKDQPKGLAVPFQWSRVKTAFGVVTAYWYASLTPPSEKRAADRSLVDPLRARKAQNGESTLARSPVRHVHRL
jgi:hypothetical protein